LLSDTNGGIYGMYDIEKGCIDCETNDELFLAIAALRDDTDKNQWFVDKFGNWSLSVHEKVIMTNEIKALIGVHKATVQELIEHFKS